MRREWIIPVMAALLGAAAARAHVTAGSTCTNCHTATSGRAASSASLTTNSTSDPGVVAGRKKYVVQAGQIVNLAINVTSGGAAAGDQYAVALSGLSSATTRAGALNAADTLTFAADTAWNARGTGSSSYATRGPFSWSSAANYTYSMSVAANTPADYYPFTFYATGMDTDMWTNPETFYVQVTPVPEPGTMMLAAGLFPLLLLHRRRA